MVKWFTNVRRTKLKRYLVLEDGAVFAGKAFGAMTNTLGEVVFSTGMTGYQESITDQSYVNQILVFTNPLIGNYGINFDDNESLEPGIKGVICHHLARRPSNWRNQQSLGDFLTDHQIPGLQGIDTRELVRHLRSAGTLRGMLTDDVSDLPAIVAQLKATNPTKGSIAAVSTKSVYPNPGYQRNIVVVDFGIKQSILRELAKRDCNVVVVPYNTTAKQIENLHPDGILLSNGPGDPMEMISAIKMIAEVEKHYPVFGICMGHQLFALANGAKTYKMKFGHRGFNHPVRDLASGKTYFTSQNHGYAVDAASVKETQLTVSQVEVNDGTVEGLRHKQYPAFSLQFHPDAAPGPHDAASLFDTFIKLVDDQKEAHHHA
ncbi:glutamine-hydrolyzing carbamoyl-phosphate synthase small subunit [Lactobacillus alvi]|uniref:Carbamoyl phosphate synthase small chain n=1 Tax=Limosilactobacillus alvi TaxID=990412 RepID=A0ABS2ENK2_9LACO|nr:carbamoyl phosphate synthase small subunit [Limosilactobacillus alvi]MBM6753988.1 glutamine-hydrolyzing carbamoyl-phosphate synthase small subunit [Limosilactobacillus alvi]